MNQPKTVRIPQEALFILRDILSFFQTPSKSEIPEEENQLWLVGGAVRDLLMGVTDLPDLDLAIPASPTLPAKKYARQSKAGFVVLDEEHGIARIVKTVQGRNINLDIAMFREKDIENDLRNRDFTINAMAIPLQLPLEDREYPVFDPLNGTDHLSKKLLFPCSDKLFIDDPLRLMRAFRFGARFDCELSPQLVDLIRRDAHLITQVSWERIRDEFFKTFSCRHSCKWIRMLTETGVLEHILPELHIGKGVTQNAWHHLDVFDHTLATLEEFEGILSDGVSFSGFDKFKFFLNEPISAGRTFEELFKFACLLHDLGKPKCRKVEGPDGKVVFHGHEMLGVNIAREIGERFRLSSNEIQLLGRIVKNHMRPGVLVQEGLTDRRLFRYFSETGRDGVGIALLSLADRRSARGSWMADDLEVFQKGILQIAEDFYKQMEYARRAPLLTGDDLINELEITPGPLFKKILEEVREAQHLGTIKTREEAVQLALKELKKQC